LYISENKHKRLLIKINTTIKVAKGEGKKVSSKRVNEK
jgi:hypothetical protein